MTIHTETAATRKEMIAALASFVAERRTDFPISDADPILAHKEAHPEADALSREEAELAAAIRLMAFLRDA